jgi:hypothetical protein
MGKRSTRYHLLSSSVNMITSECPGKRSEFRKKPHDKLLNRSLLELGSFEMFTKPWFRKARTAAKAERVLGGRTTLTVC